MTAAVFGPTSGVREFLDVDDDDDGKHWDRCVGNFNFIGHLIGGGNAACRASPFSSWAESPSSSCVLLLLLVERDARWASVGTPEVMDLDWKIAVESSRSRASVSGRLNPFASLP
jgi:hypothetical protein